MPRKLVDLYPEKRNILQHPRTAIEEPEQQRNIKGLAVQPCTHAIRSMPLQFRMLVDWTCKTQNEEATALNKGALQRAQAASK